jgi:hypothetical protein
MPFSMPFSRVDQRSPVVPLAPNSSRVDQRSPVVPLAPNSETVARGRRSVICVPSISRAGTWRITSPVALRRWKTPNRSVTKPAAQSSLPPEKYHARCSDVDARPDNEHRLDRKPISNRSTSSKNPGAKRRIFQPGTFFARCLKSICIKPKYGCGCGQREETLNEGGAFSACSGVSRTSRSNNYLREVTITTQCTNGCLN